MEGVRRAADAFAEAALKHPSAEPGIDALVAVPRHRLKAELEVVGVEGFQSTELMTRDGLRQPEIVDQHKAAVVEIRMRLAEIEKRERRLLWWRKSRCRVRAATSPVLPSQGFDATPGHDTLRQNLWRGDGGWRGNQPQLT